MLLCLAHCLPPLEDLLDLVDAATWTIEFVPGQLVGRTGGIAESAVHAITQNFIGFLSGSGLQQRVW